MRLLVHIKGHTAPPVRCGLALRDSITIAENATEKWKARTVGNDQEVSESPLHFVPLARMEIAILTF